MGGWCRFPMWDFVQVAAVVTPQKSVFLRQGRRRVALLGTFERKVDLGLEASARKSVGLSDC
ncbi:unnamed protein product [Prunus armeniaca]